MQPRQLARQFAPVAKRPPANRAERDFKSAITVTVLSFTVGAETITRYICPKRPTPHRIFYFRNRWTYLDAIPAPHDRHGVDGGLFIKIIHNHIHKRRLVCIVTLRIMLPKICKYGFFESIRVNQSLNHDYTS
jgi:hypothetical protein